MKRSFRCVADISIASSDGFDQSMGAEIQRWRQACVEVIEGAPGRHLAEVLEPVVYSSSYLEEHSEERSVARRSMEALPSGWYSDLITLLDVAAGFDLDPYLERIGSPTLVVAAGEDGFIPRSRCRALAEKIPSARFEIIPSAGHAVVVEKPHAVLERIEGFIRP